MKHYIMTTGLAVALIMTACNSENESEMAISNHETTIKFSITGDFTLTTNDFTRALTADGRDMTDVWVFDYQGTTLKQQIHQTNEDDDFGTPTMELGLGEHHIYFVASRGATPALDTDAKTITWTTVRDTFWKDYSINISSATSSGSRSVALDRVVTKMKVVFSDAIPTGAAAFNVTPASWYYGMSYQTGEPVTATSNRTVTVNIPNTSIGVTGESVSIYGLSSATEWTTDVALDCKDSENGVLGSATITAAPFLRNRVSEYTGPLFTAGGGMMLSLNTNWSTSYTGTW